MKATMIPLNATDGKTSLLWPFIAERIKKMATEMSGEVDPDQIVRILGQRFYGGDPGLCIVAFVDDMSHIVGHGILQIESDGVNHWAFVPQIRLDGGTNWEDTMDTAFKKAAEWVKGYNNLVLLPAGAKPATELLMATERPDGAWKRRLGFDGRRSIMVKKLPIEE